MDLSSISQKVDTLVSRMMEACEKEGATLLEVKGAATRFQRMAEARIEEISAETKFSVGTSSDD